MRARVRVGVTSRRRTGPMRSGLIENSIDSSSPSAGAALSPGASCSSFSGSMLDRVGLDGGRGGDRRGDDFALRVQALHARVDHVGAKLVEVEKADDQNEQAAEIEHDDAPRQRGGKTRDRRRARRGARAISAARRGRAREPARPLRSRCASALIAAPCRRPCRSPASSAARSRRLTPPGNDSPRRRASRSSRIRLRRP